MNDLTKSGNVGVRWQAQMEEHLSVVRSLTDTALRLTPMQNPAGSLPEHALVRATLANAHATAALTLALANGLGDLEMVLSHLRVED